MDPLLALVFIVAIALVVALGRSVRLARWLERLRVLAGASEASPAAIEARVAAIIDASAASERSLQAARADMAALVSAMPIGVLLVDDGLIVRVANPAAHAITERRPGTIVGRTLIETFVEPRVESIASDARVAGSAHGEVHIHDREPRSLVVSAQRLASGEIWIIVQDVSELRRLERIRTEFVDNLAHELRTPLSNVSLLIEALSRQADAAGTSVDPKMRQRIAKIEVETGHLVQMVNELLDLARIEGSSVTVLVDEIDMVAVARASVGRMRAFADEQGVQLSVEASASSPAVRGDEDRIAQVLVNLLHNAVKFSSPGGTVTVRVTAGDGEVLTSVEDHGIGVRPADQARIFERFYKVDRARVRGGGTGLGLSIARHIVEAHGGRIGVRSEELRGSTFWFSLPIDTGATAGSP